MTSTPLGALNPVEFVKKTTGPDHFFTASLRDKSAYAGTQSPLKKKTKGIEVSEPLLVVIALDHHHRYDALRLVVPK